MTWLMTPHISQSVILVIHTVTYTYHGWYNSRKRQWFHSDLWTVEHNGFFILCLVIRSFISTRIGQDAQLIGITWDRKDCRWNPNRDAKDIEVTVGCQAIRNYSVGLHLRVVFFELKNNRSICIFVVAGSIQSLSI